MKIDRTDLNAALDLLEARHPDAAMSFGTILNPGHFVNPFGIGVCVTLSSKDSRVFEKAKSSFLEAMQRACDRLDQRLAGDAGA